MDIYTINGDLRSLLLVDGIEVINGGWDLKQDEEGCHVSRNKKLRVTYLGKCPEEIEDERGRWDYNAMLTLAFDKFHLPLFDGPRTSSEEYRISYYKNFVAAPGK